MDLQALVETENASVIDAIVRSLRLPTGVIPFIGAGMSHDYGAPMWGDFLELVAVTDEEKAEVRRLIKEGKYEDAAQFLGVKDDGKVQAGTTDLGSLQRSISREIGKGISRHLSSPSTPPECKR